MCGIFAVTGDTDAAATLVAGLKRLEYRGYDSAGLAVHGPEGISIRKEAGNVSALEALVGRLPVSGATGIALGQKALRA